LKLAQLVHSQALRAETPDANGLCIEWANATKTKLPMRRIAAPNDNGNSGSSIATPSRLHKRGRIASLIDAIKPYLLCTNLGV
ncbi:MAG: hypothetical protein WA725_08445, partial [Pseudolabrys sp.]